MNHPSRLLTRSAFVAWSLTCVGQAPIRADDAYLIKLKSHPGTGKSALVQKQETIHSHSKLVGLEAKKILENNEEKQTTLAKYRETILEVPKGQDDPTRLRRDYEKAQVEVGGKTTVLPIANGRPTVSPPASRPARRRLAASR